MDRARHDLTPASLTAARSLLRALYRASESSLLPPLLEMAHSTAEENIRIRERARRLVEQQRAAPGDDWIAGFLSEYSLDSAEGMALLALAEAFLRVPDTWSARELLRDKIGQADWRAHAGGSPSTFVNATTFGLVLAGALVRDDGGVLKKLLQRTSEAFLHRTTAAALRLMAGHFVLGETIEEGLAQARDRQLVCSFDMLGEAARTRADADRYFTAYEQAILACGEAQAAVVPHSISVKLSALHPRYEVLQADRCVPELADRLAHLSRLAAERHIGLNVDAEESERLELSLDIIERVARQAQLRDWQGPGVVVQAYQKRAIAVVAWADCLARETGKRLPVRLVKGAYWDTEIKRCQERGLADYPVWLRKSGTDVTYLACARRLLACPRLYPAFATHNALTVATLLSWIGPRHDLEFQRLHGMGAALYGQLQAQEGILCRVYAPIGSHRELLAYLVRRMLENGANSSFVHQLKDERITERKLLADPVEAARQTLDVPHPFVRLPVDLFAPERRNSTGVDLSDRGVLDALAASFERHWQSPVQAAPSSTANTDAASSIPVVSPANPRLVAGTVRHATAADVDAALVAAVAAQERWADTSVEQRADILRRLADLLEEQRDALMALLIREAGKTRADAVSEVREAVDFCRYYAAQAIVAFAERHLPGPTGERNTLRLHGRGVFACISPWNFPLSIFAGQIGAALVTGNTVLAKPAPQTPLIAAATVRLAWQAGVPSEVLQLLPGGGEVGDVLAADARVDGVVFTGSTATARRIAQRLLEDSTRPLVPLIAETGGINAMIVDSTALTEQVCGDVITSAFQSAGQRCSALRLLCLQDEIYERTLDMIRGAMLELRVGDPADESTDVGPLIDGAAYQRIDTYLQARRDRIVCATPLPPDLPGWFIAPTVVALDAPEDLQEEVFGPVLHVVRWHADRLEELVDALNRSHYGLTMGVHTRLDSVVDLVRCRARVGNLYVNRSMIGAVVGSQPFGGEGLSGTGPKAGGPHYLTRFCTERSVSIDTTSAGGNATLMGMDAEAT